MRESIEAIDARRRAQYGTADLEKISEIDGYFAGLSGAPRVVPTVSLPLRWLQAYDDGQRDRARDER